MSSVEGTMPLPKRYADVPPHAAGRGSRVAGRGSRLSEEILSTGNDVSGIGGGVQPLSVGVTSCGADCVTDFGSGASTRLEHGIDRVALVGGLPQ